jgi:peroxiredoxin
MAALGATLVAVSPQTAATNRVVRRKLGLTFAILSDAGLQLSQSLGLVFELPDPLRRVYRSFGIDLAQANADGTWRLPMPARLIVGSDRRVRQAEVNADYTTRPEPSETLAELERVARG